MQIKIENHTAIYHIFALRIRKAAKPFCNERSEWKNEALAEPVVAWPTGSGATGGERPELLAFSAGPLPRAGVLFCPFVLALQKRWSVLQLFSKIRK